MRRRGNRARIVGPAADELRRRAGDRRDAEQVGDEGLVDPVRAAGEDQQRLPADVEHQAVGDRPHLAPQGLGGDSTAFAVHVEVAATHITMNPVAVNMQCHSARRASATITARGVEYGF